MNLPVLVWYLGACAYALIAGNSFAGAGTTAGPSLDAGVFVRLTGRSITSTEEGKA